MGRMYLRVLGSLEAVTDGVGIDIAGGKERTLLAVLLVYAGRTVSAQTLIDELWAVDPPASAGAGVHVFVSRLRRQLGPSDVGRLRRGLGGYVLDVDQGGSDAGVFENQVAQARSCLARGDRDRACGALVEADRMWRGPAFQGVTSNAVHAEATRLEDLRVAARELRFDAELALGRHRSALADIDAATAENPLHERFWAQRMLALYRCGRQADALSAYRTVRELTRSELGTDPTPELQRLELAILRQDGALDWATTAAPASQRLVQVQSLWQDYERGRLGAVAAALDELDRVVGPSTSLDASRTLIAAERGDHLTARRHIDAVLADDFRALRSEPAWLSSLCLIGSAAARIGHTEAARAVAHHLEPYAGQFGLLWSGACSGPVDLHLGRIARALGDLEGAALRFERAIALSRGLGMPSAAVTAEVELIETRLALDWCPEARAAAIDDLDRVTRAADELGMDRLTPRIEALRRADADATVAVA